MPKLSDLLAEKARAEIQVGGATVNVMFYVLWRDRFSEGEWADLIATPGREHIKQLLPRIALSWDIEDDDGHAVPITAEAFDQHNLPTDLLMAIATRLTGSDLAGKVPSSNNSRAT
jgi:hypothetical protein